MDRDHWAFGAGYVQNTFRALPPKPVPSPIFIGMRRRRRICPAIHVAERELWLAISRLLWAYDIRSPPDEHISLEGYNGQSSRQPEPYRIALTPRHDRVQALLEEEGEVTLMKL
jgi:hypothetical protein